MRVPDLDEGGEHRDVEAAVGLAPAVEGALDDGDGVGAHLHRGAGGAVGAGDVAVGEEAAPLRLEVAQACFALVEEVFAVDAVVGVDDDVAAAAHDREVAGGDRGAVVGEGGGGVHGGVLVDVVDVVDGAGVGAGVEGVRHGGGRPDVRS